MLEKLFGLLKIQSRSVYSVDVKTDGIHCSDSKLGDCAIEWGSIQAIDGFKRDQVTTDLICLAITYGVNKVAEINEDMEGFANVVTELERQNFLKPSWRKYIDSEPFNSRRCILFQKHNCY